MDKLIYRGHELDARVWNRIKNDQKFKKMFDDCLDDKYRADIDGYFPPPWDFYQYPEKTEGWIEFQRAMREDPNYYSRKWI